MFLYDQYVLPKKILNTKNLSCYLSLKELSFAFDLSTNTFRVADLEGSKNIAGSNKYYKITYNEKNKNYYCICRGNTKWAQTIFTLDESFEEIDHITCCFDLNATTINDIYFDVSKNILYAVTPRKIIRLTLNGDNLGVFMTASNSRMYDCICTFRHHIFILYEEKNGLFLASYTLSGSFVEKLPISSEYSVRNMQVIQKKESYFISIFAYKNKQYPYILEIKLEGKPKHKIKCDSMQIETEERNDMNVTCNLKI